MKKQNIVIIIASVALIGTIVFFGFNLVDSSKNKEDEKEKGIVSEYWNTDKNVKEVVCFKTTNKNIYDKEVEFLNKIEYHIEYDKENAISKEYYQYYLIYPTEAEYYANENFYVEDEIGKVEHFDDYLTNLDTHYVLKQSSYVFDYDDLKETGASYDAYMEALKNPYTEEVAKLKNEGYTCK